MENTCICCSAEVPEGRQVCPVCEGLTFTKTVNVTNLKNVLVQMPKVIVADWGLKVGDELEFIYKDGEATIRPYVRRRSELIKSRN